jgi:anti-sigma factor RsiW
MTSIDCTRAREAMLDEQHGKLAEDSAVTLQRHLQTCASCSKLQAEEHALSELLRTRLSRPRAPRALHERLSAQLAPMPEVRRRSNWWRQPQWAGAIAAAALLMAAGFLAKPQLPWAGEAPSAFVREAVNDHLRVVYAEHPIEIASGGIHQVKPWFTGRLDFAPDIAFSGDDDFPLVGGAVGYFIDRKAATLVFKRRLHTISCFVFPAKDLSWPHGESRSIAPGHPAELRALDGFHILYWREGELGHALVSDVNEAELLTLGRKLVDGQ